MPRPKIKVFWDLVTCPISRSYRSVGEALKDIRTFTSNFGVVTNIKAYWDRNKLRHPDDNLHVAMPSMGVNLVDCSSMQGYTGDALTKMLSVDVVMSAMDDPITTETSEDDIILIISGDKSVLYPISLLMFRNYTVFLVVPDDDANTRFFQATRVFSWYRDVLGCTVSPEPATISIPETLKSPGSGWIVNGTHVPQLNLDSPSVGRTSSNVISPRSEHSMYTSSPKPTTAVTSPAATPRSKDRSIPPSEPSYSRAPSVLSLNSDPRTTSKSPVNFGTVASGRHEHINASVPRLARTQPDTSTIPAPQILNSEQNEKLTDWGQEDWSAAGGWNEGGSWETAGLNWLSEAVPAPKSAAKSRETPREVVPPKQEAKPLAWKKPQNQDRDSGSTRENKVPAVKNEVRTPSSHDPPISVFNPLVEILRGSEKGTMMRSQLGEYLAKRRGLYQSAGANGFGEFIALAVKKNIVIICGSGNHQQVKLRKK